MAALSDRELLRLHLEAVWSISLPPVVGAHVDLDPDGPLPPWSLYLAHFSVGEVAIWRPETRSDRRVTLLRRGHEANIAYDPTLDMRCEVVLRAPDVPPAAPSRHHARLLTTTDAALLEAFEVGESSYYLDPQHGPCFGVLVDGRLASVAHSSRRTAQACELGVNTLADARRQGCANAATLAWTQAVRGEGLEPIYSAFTWNEASRALAASCGYTPAIQGAYGPMPIDPGARQG
jgi:RimJ/RimL family protein N-acetyltransferase